MVRVRRLVGLFGLCQGRSQSEAEQERPHGIQVGEKTAQVIGLAGAMAWRPGDLVPACLGGWSIQWFTAPTSSSLGLHNLLLITKEMNGCSSVNYSPLSNGPRSPLIGLNSPRGLNRSESHLENLMSLHTYLRPHKARQNVVRHRLIGSQLVSSQFVVPP